MLAVTGCQTLREMGFESRASRLARKLDQTNKELASRNEELQSRLVSTVTEQKTMQGKITRLEMDLVREKRRVATPPTPTADTRLEKLAKMLGPLGTPIVTPEGARGIRINGDFLFRSGKTDVRSEAKATLAKLATIVKNADDGVIIFVDGHTDADPLRVTKKLYGDNYGLGAARANAVAREFIKLGAPRERLVTRSFGQDVPIAGTKTQEGKKKNRRVEIVFALANVARVTRTSAGQ